jgi:hypothetical protein
MTDMVGMLRDIAVDVDALQQEKQKLSDAVLQLKIELAEANGCVKTLDRQNNDLKDRLQGAVKDATYFREKVTVVTQSATRMADELVSLIKDVERKPTPMLSLDDLEEKPPQEMKASIPQVKLTPSEMAKVKEMPDGAVFTIYPEGKMDRMELKIYYRRKFGEVPPNWKQRPGVVLKKIGNQIERLRFDYTQVQPFRADSPALPEAPNIPDTATRSFDSHGQLGDNGDEVPAFLRKPINGGHNDGVG